MDMTDTAAYLGGNPGEYRYEKALPDGRVTAVMALTFGRARIIVAENASAWRSGYSDGW